MPEMINGQTSGPLNTGAPAAPSPFARLGKAAAGLGAGMAQGMMSPNFRNLYNAGANAAKSTMGMADDSAADQDILQAAARDAMGARTLFSKGGMRR